jgi:hypothetical protein
MIAAVRVSRKGIIEAFVDAERQSGRAPIGGRRRRSYRLGENFGGSDCRCLGTPTI